MRGVRGEAPLAFERVAEASGGPVEGLGRVVEFAHAAAGSVCREVALTQSSGRSGEGFDRAHQVARDEQAGHAGPGDDDGG